MPLGPCAGACADGLKSVSACRVLSGPADCILLVNSAHRIEMKTLLYRAGRTPRCLWNGRRRNRDHGFAVVWICASRETQTPDPFVRAEIGAGNVHVCRGAAQVMFDDVPMERFGDRLLPPSFEVICPLRWCPSRWFIGKVMVERFTFNGCASRGAAADRAGLEPNGACLGRPFQTHPATGLSAPPAP